MQRCFWRRRDCFEWHFRLTFFGSTIELNAYSKITNDMHNSNLIKLFNQLESIRIYTNNWASVCFILWQQCHCYCIHQLEKRERKNKSGHTNKCKCTHAILEICLHRPHCNSVRWENGAFNGTARAENSVVTSDTNLAYKMP